LGKGRERKQETGRSDDGVSKDENKDKVDDRIHLGWEDGRMSRLSHVTGKGGEGEGSAAAGGEGFSEHVSRDKQGDTTVHIGRKDRKKEKAIVFKGRKDSSNWSGEPDMLCSRKGEHLYTTGEGAPNWVGFNMGGEEISKNRLHSRCVRGGWGLLCSSIGKRSEQPSCPTREKGSTSPPFENKENETYL